MSNLTVLIYEMVAERMTLELIAGVLKGQMLFDVESLKLEFR